MRLVIRDVQLCICREDQATDCETCQHTTRSRLFDQVPSLTIHHVSQQCRSETLDLVKQTRMKTLHACSPTCLAAPLSLCNDEQLIRIQKMCVYVDNNYILTPEKRPAWYVNPLSLTKIHHATAQVAECFFSMNDSNRAGPMVADVVQRNLNNLPILEQSWRSYRLLSILIVFLDPWLLLDMQTACIFDVTGMVGAAQIPGCSEERLILLMILAESLRLG
jgi:hypothetical protein